MAVCQERKPGIRSLVCSPGQGAWSGDPPIDAGGLVVTAWPGEADAMSEERCGGAETLPLPGLQETRCLSGDALAGIQVCWGLSGVSEGLCLSPHLCLGRRDCCGVRRWGWLLPALGRACWHPGPCLDPRLASQGSHGPVADLRTLPLERSPLGGGTSGGSKVLC